MNAEMEWRKLPDLPQALGGEFVAGIGASVIVAGGTCLACHNGDCALAG